MPFLVWFAIGLPGTYIEFATDPYLWGQFIVSTFFLNTLHTAFTFYAVGYLPEFRRFVARNDAHSKVPFAVEIALVGGALFAFFLVILTGPGTKELFGLGVLFYYAVNIFHSFRQMMGVGAMYDQGLSASGVPVSHATSPERRLMHLMLAIMMANVFIVPLLEFDLGVLWRFGAFVLTALLSLAIYLVVLAHHPLSRSNKAIFYLRLFFFPMGAINPVATLAIGACHGIEYTVVFCSMLKRSAFRPSVRHYVVLAISVLAVCVCSFPRFDTGIPAFIRLGSVDGFRFLRVISAFSLSVTTLHFYLDGRLYKMKKAEVRETIGTLLRPVAVP